MSAEDAVAMVRYLDAWRPGMEWHCTTDPAIRPCGRCAACRDDARAWAAREVKRD